MTEPRLKTIYPARPSERTMTVEDLWALPRVGSPVPSPDGRAVAVTVTTFDMEKNAGKGRIFLLSEGQPPRPLTAADAAAGSPAFSPDGKRIAFTRKVDGQDQLHVLPLDGGEAEKLTDLPLGVFDPRFLPDGRAIVFGTTLIEAHLTPDTTRAEMERRDKDPVKAHVTEERVYRYWDSWLTGAEVHHLFALELASGQMRDLTPDVTDYFDWMDPSGQYDISPDGREIVFAMARFEESRSLLRSALHVVALDGAVAAAAPVCLTSDHPADDVRPRYTPDGERIVYGMQHDPFFYADRVRLMAYDRRSATHAEILGDWRLSPSSWEVAADGTIFIVAEEDARVNLYGWNGVGHPRALVAGGSIGAATPAATGRVFFSLQTLQQPPEIHSVAADGSGQRRETHFTDAALLALSLGEVRDYRYEGAEGVEVQMFVVLPPGYEPGRRYPLVHVIHGGPHGISSDGFHFRWNAQLFAAPGYVVAEVNFQGSTSWGQDFAQRIQGAWPDRPFTDIMNATDVLIDAGVADADRMAAAGGSYGGYMAAWIAGHTDRFKCIVNHAGVFDTLSEYACDITQGRARAFGGEPWEGIEAVDRGNPVRFAAGFHTPMLIIHGARDYRVPADQGLECYGILKAKGVPARLVYFPDENHWVLKPQNSRLWYREVHGWLARFLAS